jgi:recombination protein RecT
MGLKTAIRRLCKFLPKSPELAAALALDAASEQGKEQNLNLNDVIEGNYAPVVDEETGEISEPKVEQTTQSKPASAAKASAAKAEAEPNAKLKAIFEQMAATTTTEALDEIYVRAEGELDGTELEALMREYRKCKNHIGSLI